MKVLIFVLMKIVELSVLIFAPYYLGYYCKPLLVVVEYEFLGSCLGLWGGGVVLMILGVGGLIILAVVSFFVWLLIKANWKWAGRIRNRIK